MRSEKFMSIFYCGVQHTKIVTHTVRRWARSRSFFFCRFLSLFFSLSMCSVHSHKYCERTICYMLHRKTCELIKVFRKEKRVKHIYRERKRNRGEGAGRWGGGKTESEEGNEAWNIFAKQYKMDYDAFFLFASLHRWYLEEKCIFIITFVDRWARVTTKN